LGQTDAEIQASIIDSSTQANRLNKKIDLLDILVLSRLWVKPMGGYQLRIELQKHFDLRVSFGTLYPHLKNLERRKFVCQEERLGGHKKRNVYTLTPSGVSALKNNAVTIAKISETLRPVLDSK